MYSTYIIILYFLFFFLSFFFVFFFLVLRNLSRQTNKLKILFIHWITLVYIYIPVQKYKTILNNEEKVIVYNF